MLPLKRTERFCKDASSALYNENYLYVDWWWWNSSTAVQKNQTRSNRFTHRLNRSTTCWTDKALCWTILNWSDFFERPFNSLQFFAFQFLWWLINGRPIKVTTYQSPIWGLFFLHQTVRNKGTFCYQLIMLNYNQIKRYFKQNLFLNMPPMLKSLLTKFYLTKSYSKTDIARDNHLIRDVWLRLILFHGFLSLRWTTSNLTK